MRLIILDKDEMVGEWAAKYVVKRINEYKANDVISLDKTI